MSDDRTGEALSAARRDLFIRIYEAWNKGERDYEEFTSKDFRLHSTMSGETYEGPEGARRYFAEIDEQFDQWELKIDEIRDAGSNRMLAFGSLHLRGRVSGVEFDQPIAWLVTFDDGLRPLEMHTFNDHDAGIAAAGLSDG